MSMTPGRSRTPRHRHSFAGNWHITAMEAWDADYVNMERQAFIEIGRDGRGSFQFGLVCGELDGYLEQVDRSPSRQRFAFTWEGNDEMDPASGSGWLELTGKDDAVGLITLHGSDRSEFLCRRVG